MNSSRTVFVDTDAFIALSKENDSNHKKALRIFAFLEKKDVIFFTSNYVFSEAVTVLSMRVGRAAALAFIKELKSSPNSYHAKWVTEEIEDLAIEKYKKQTTKNISFTDCTNMAIVDEYAIDYIFSFDAIYKKNSYKLAA